MTRAPGRVRNLPSVGVAVRVATIAIARSVAFVESGDEPGLSPGAGAQAAGVIALSALALPFGMVAAVSSSAPEADADAGPRRRRGWRWPLAKRVSATAALGAHAPA
jgi:hypothetical protein